MSKKCVLADLSPSDQLCFQAASAMGAGGLQYDKFFSDLCVLVVLLLLSVLFGSSVLDTRHDDLEESFFFMETHH